MSPDEWTAAATVVNAALVFILVAATIFYATQTKATVDELREARIAGYVPLLHWQSPTASVQHDLYSDEGALRSRSVLQLIEVVLWNIGPGAARVVAASATSDTSESWEWPALGVPSTIPPGNETTQYIRRKVSPGEFAPATVALTLKIEYVDVSERRRYETRIRIRAHFQEAPPTHPPQIMSVTTEFLDSDERSAAQRRIV
jgi:hypothetical protein